MSGGKVNLAMNTHDASVNHPMTDAKECQLSIMRYGGNSFSISGLQGVLPWERPYALFSLKGTQVLEHPRCSVEAIFADTAEAQTRKNVTGFDR